MTNTVLIKRSATANAVPTGGQLANGEIAINYADGNLFFKDSGGSVQTLASKKFVSVTGNITGGNVETGTVSATGNVEAGNLNAAGLSLSANVVSALNSTANITTTANIAGGYFVGNGSQLTGLPASYNDANVATLLANFGSNVVSTTGNVTTGNLTVNGNITYVNSNVVTINDKFINVANNAATSGAANGGGLGVGPVDAEYATLIFNNGTTAWNTNIPLSVNGNVAGNYFVGNGSALTSISGASVVGAVANATYAVSAGSAGSAVTAEQVTSNAQANITSVGILSSLSASGNITGGNVTAVSLLKTADFSITGNVTGNLLPSANITYDLGSNTQRWKDLYLSGNTIQLGSQTISANATSVSLGADAELAANNVFATNQVSGATVSASGNIVAGGSGSSGQISATGNITGGNLITGAAVSAASVSASGNVTGGNVNAAGLSLSSNVISEINSSANITTTANIAGNYFIGNGSQLTGIAGGGGNYSNANVATFLADFGSNVISTTGNITGGNVISAGVRVYKWTTQANTAPSNPVPGDNWYDSYADKLYLYINDGVGNQWVDQSSPTTFASLNILGNTASGNLSTLGQVSAAGNVTGNYIFGNGALLTGVITSVANINNGTSNVTVVSSGGNITVSVGGTANVVQFANTGAFVTGVVSATGNVQGGNLRTTGLISATGNITGGNVSVTGNVQGGNLRTTGVISATGNSVLAGRDLAVGGAVNSFSASGRGTIALNGTSTTLFEMVTAGATSGYMYHNGTDMYLWQSRSGLLGFATNNTERFTISSTGAFSGAGNITGGNILGTTAVSTTGNVQGGNLRTTGLISATGNVTSGNILTAGLISATGNITSGNLITGAGSGGNITGANVISANTVTATANVTGGNLLTGGLISATGNVTGGNLIISGSISDSAQLDINTTSANANIVLTPNGTGNVNTGANVSVTGNITAGNILGVPVATNGIVVNSLTVATSYTIETGYSGTSAGPITIAGGVVVTVSPGSRWVVI